MKDRIAFSFLVIGKTQESKETQEFARYIGVGSTRVLAVNPDKKTLDELMGFESQKEPQYIADGERGKEARIHFIVRTDPEQCNGIEITGRLMFTLRATPAYNRDQTKVQVIDEYGNSTWANIEDAKAGKTLVASNGTPLKIGKKYRMACSGEADLVSFLKTYLCVQDAFSYINGAWVLKDNANDCLFGLEHIKDYFNGDFSELAEAIKLREGNKVKLLYGVRTVTDDKGTRQYQDVATREGLILPNNAGTNALARLQKNLTDAKNSGAYANTEFAVQELTEYKVNPTNLAQETQATEEKSPWD